MFNFIKKLFTTKTVECNCSKCKKPATEKSHIDVVRNGCKLRLSLAIANYLDAQGYYYTVLKIKKRPTVIQVTQTINGKTVYIGSLKKMFNVKEFKDGNLCNFVEDNLIYNQKKEGC